MACLGAPGDTHPTAAASRSGRPAAHPSARHRSLPRAVLALLLAGGLSGCGTVGGVANVLASSAANAMTPPAAPTYLRWRGLRIVADADANANTPVALDLVFVRDKPTLDALLALPAGRWFATRNEWLRSHPGALTVRSLELVPRQALRLSERDLGSPLVAGVLLFADYTAPGEHRARLPDLTQPTEGGLVRLSARGFSVTAEPLEAE